MIKNKLTIWDINLLDKNNEFFIDSILDNMESLEINLSDKSNKILKMTWSDIISYRCTYESYFSYGAYFADTDKMRGKNFYLVENSEYIENIEKWSYPEVINDTLKSNLKHYGIYTVDYCVDLISASEPELRW